MTATSQRTKISNPFRPGAGHIPPYLAGRKNETEEFSRLLQQDVILENLALTGLRGVGKTVLLDVFKTTALEADWLSVEIDVSEALGSSDEKLATHLLTCLSVVTNEIPVPASQKSQATTLNHTCLKAIYDNTPGLTAHKLKHVLEFVFPLVQATGKQGIVFAIDETQNLTNQPKKGQYPLSLLLDTFHYLQRNNSRFMLALTGLPSLFEKLVSARTFAERMFRVISLGSLNEQETIEAIRKPMEKNIAPLFFSERNSHLIWEATKGFPYFIQYFCRHTFDHWMQILPTANTPPSIPINDILRKLDADFFIGRWSKTSKQQQTLLRISAQVHGADEGFFVQDVIDHPKNKALVKPFEIAEAVSLFDVLCQFGLVYSTGFGRYSFALPLLGEFIRRQGT